MERSAKSMVTGYRLFLKMVVIGAVFLSQFQQASAFECGHALKDLTLSEAPALDSKVIDQKIQNLSELKLALDLAKADGTFSIALGAMTTHYKNQERLLVGYLEEHKIMTSAQLIERMKQQIATLQNQNNTDQKEIALRREEQGRLIKESAIVGRIAVFHKIQPGSLTVWRGDSPVDVLLLRIPEIMETSMTQIIYKRVAELANLRFPQKYQIDTDPSYNKGDTKPVEKVSYMDVKQWTKALNDLSDAGEPALKGLISGHKDGMRYKGFMSEVLRRYLMMKAKTENGESFDHMTGGGDQAKLGEYAVFKSGNYEGTTEVDQKKPLFIDGKEFYGLFGNVSEWVSDPIEEVGRERLFYGGNWTRPDYQLGSHYITSSDDRLSEVGFRLVRELPVTIADPLPKVNKRNWNVFSNIKRMFQ